MTSRVAWNTMRRPRRRLGELLGVALRCPLCGGAELRTVAYRPKTARLECKTCTLRFSLDPLYVGAALVATPQPIADRWSKDMSRVLRFLVAVGLDSPDLDTTDGVIAKVRTLGEVIMAAAVMKPAKAPSSDPTWGDDGLPRAQEAGA